MYRGTILCALQIPVEFCFQVYCTAFSYCTSVVRFSYRTSSGLGTLWVPGSSLGADCESGLTAKVNTQF